MATVDRERPRPALLVGLGATSLILFGLIGWGLRTLREQEPVVPQATTPGLVRAGERGRLVFQVHCARCHGLEGRGDGPDSATLKPPPRDFRATPWSTAATRESVRKAVVQGVPNSMMPALGGALSSVELEAVVDHVLSLTRVPVSPELISRAGFRPVPEGRPTPPPAVFGTSDKPITLDQLRGKLVVIVFWGTSCLPCQKELPALEKLAERFHDDGLEVLPVCVDETDLDTARRVAAESAPGLPVLVDSTGATRLAFDVQALPSAALIGPDGRLLGQAEGALDWSGESMETMIRAALRIEGPQGRVREEPARGVSR